ncbi:MAG TPA: hypothetical protein PLV59_01925 [Candidatus Dojkabacteria bacterium]|nr:hypothetical protein [Candidatus Dojkabacteria bacterium]
MIVWCDMYIEFLALYLFWFIAWGIYNYYFNLKGFSTEYTPLRTSLFFYFLFCLLFISFDLVVYTENLASWWLGVGALVGLCTTRNIYFARFSNSLFQMLWVYALSVVITTDLLHLALLFFVGHIPIFLLPHLSNKGRLFIFVSSFAGGIIFALIYHSFDFLPAIVVNSLIHTLFYAILRPYDRKLHMNIIN